MMPNFFDLLQVYLVPFMIAVPIGLLLIFFSRRKGGDNQIENNADLPDLPPVQPPAPPVPGAAPGVDSSYEKTQLFRAPPPQAPSHGVSVSPGGGIDIPLAESVSSGPGLDLDVGPDTVMDELQQRAKLNILVVDDSAVPRAKLRKLFETHGYQVEAAADGVQAMEAINKTKFAVIITDLEMPHMDGFELIAAVQGSLETEDIPVIAITGHDEMQARVHNIQGLYGIFKKPWNDRELLKRVDVLASIKK
jgi:CheY-like chemotaxis protein